jgi:tRNA (guanine-N(7)-)-methyltransferase subunit TRM82
LTGRFVSALHIPPADPSSLISGGGDPVVKVWDWISGRLRWEVSVWELVEQFVGVDRVGGKSGEGEGESEGGTGEGENSRKKRGKKQDKKGKAKAKSKGKEDDVKADEVASENRDEVSVSLEDTPQSSKVLVIQQIESISTARSGTYILFSAVGYVSRFCASLTYSNASFSVLSIWGDKEQRPFSPSLSNLTCSLPKLCILSLESLYWAFVWFIPRIRRMEWERIRP